MGDLNAVKVKLADLKKHYEDAKDGHLDKFQFEGEFIVTNYAKYLIQHLENEIARADEKLWHQ